MAQYKLSNALLQTAVDAALKLGQVEAARATGVNQRTFRDRMAEAVKRGLVKKKDLEAATQRAGEIKKGMIIEPGFKIEDSAGRILQLQDTISDLRARLRDQQREGLDEQYIKEKILGLFDDSKLVDVPPWTMTVKKTGRTVGIPITVWSDWHCGEKVFPSQVNGVNKYDMTIFRERVRRLVERTIDLLKNHMVNPNYPGIIVALIGDLVSGGIHDELMATDQVTIMPVVLEVFGIVKWALNQLAEAFGHVWLIGLSGNHGRATKKIWAKHRNFTSFDWLICKFLAEYFQNDPRFSFMVPDGLDARVVVYGHPYLFTHGDRLGRGGDGIIGSAGPIIRGTVRKQARDSQINQDFKTLVHGHYHQYDPGMRIVGNGSLIGYSEYAYVEGFPFEVPQQALWIHHPERGLTFHMGVQVEDVDAGVVGKYGASPVEFGRMA
jgi:hypothetical protein